MEDYDLRGLRCPLPALKTRHRLKSLQSGDRLVVLTDDPMAVIDIPHFCNEAGQLLLEHGETDDGDHRFVIERTDRLS